MMKPLYFLLPILAVMICFTATAQNRKPLVGKEPAWVTIDQFNYTDTHLDYEAEEGFVDLVFQQQVSLARQSRYFRSAIKILTEAGIQNSSKVAVNFDPDYEQLTFHTIKIIRGKEIINQLILSKIKTIQQEKELDRFMYNGSLSSVLFLEDVRKGDIIEYSYTIKGFNPIFKGRYSDVYGMNFTVPVYNIYYKLIVPRDQMINIKNSKINIQPVIQNLPAESIYEWRLSNSRAFHAQDDIPSWYDPYSVVRVSEYKNWKEVNDWAMELFPPVNNISPALQKKIEEIKKNSKSAQEQLLTTLRFVQDDIRYMGIEMGENSHRPSHPNKIFAQRFGDCKDKSYLLCTMLHALNIEADPVLINTSYKKTINEWLPSATAFDHVTVRVKLDDGYHWFDPTIAFQRGGIKDISYPDYQCSLVLSQNTTALTQINLKEPGLVKTKELFDIPDMSGNARLAVTTEYSGSFADNIRSSFNSSSNYEMLKGFKEFYDNYYENIIADSLNYTDDEKTGIFTTREYYTLDDLWELKDGVKKAYFNSYVIDGIIKKPPESRRTMPFNLAYPAHYKEDVEIRLPDDWDADESFDKIETPPFVLTAKFSYRDRKVLLHYEYETLKDYVLPDETEKFMDGITTKEKSLGYALSRSMNNKILPKSETRTKTKALNTDSNLFTGILVLLFIATLVWRGYKR